MDVQDLRVLLLVQQYLRRSLGVLMPAFPDLLFFFCRVEVLVLCPHVLPQYFARACCFLLP